MDIFIITALIISGLSLGSFTLALVWRIHKNRDFVKERSECEHCHHVLGAADLIPVLSWVLLRGKCRYCRKSLSWQFPATELAMAALFISSYILWPHELTNSIAVSQFVLWLGMLVGLVALFIYDARWMLLPDAITYPLIAGGVLFAGLEQLQQPEPTLLGFVSYISFGIAALAGVYWVLYLLTRGRGVGFGDVKLGIFMGAALGWQGAFLVLFLANILGLLYVLPGLVRRTLSAKSAVPFGPFLIAAFIVVMLWGEAIVRSYMDLTFGSVMLVL